MTDFPVYVWPPLNVVNPFSMEAAGVPLRATGATFLGAASGATGANVVIYWPFKMLQEEIAVKITIIVGATITGNVDVGIYDNQKNRLINSGSTALGTANTLQTFDITDTLLVPGFYFGAVTLANAAGTIFRTAQSDELSQSMMPFLTETTGGFGLPATATWVQSAAASPPVPAMGIHFDTLI